ncbi:MAG: CoA transferase [Gammaproteobacteria bacterium]|nr:CoA transferase [Gammaproteobacteria bacterium]
MPHALEGLRVLDLSSGPAAGIATMILADFGAQVIVVARPSHSTKDLLSDLPAAPMWLRGKQQLTLDLDHQDDIKRFHQLAAAADVLISNWRPAALSRRKLDYDRLHQQHPHLIYCHITGFGSRGPMANWPAYEHTIAAYSGRMSLFSGIVDRPGPVFSAVQVGIHATAQSAASGIMAALLGRNDQSQGRLIETSLLQGMQPYEMGGMIGMQLIEQFPDLAPIIAGPSAQTLPTPSLFYHPAQAADGRWMQFGNLLPHLFDNFLIATDLIDVVADEDFNPKQLLLDDAVKQEAFRARMLARIQDRPAHAWMADFIQDGGIVAATYQSTQAALDDPDLLQNGHVVERENGGVQLGPLAQLTTTPGLPGPDIIDSDTWAKRWIDSPRNQPDQTTIASTQSTLPLKGIRVIEIATIIAAPLGAAFLADMGADVIKIEPVGGDPFRGMLGGLGAARVNAGKRSVSVNLKSAQGLQVVMDLLRDADVVIHNFRPGVPERLGIDYASISALNPQIIYLQSNGYGPSGPGAHRPSTHPVPGAALGGVLYQLGGQLPDTPQALDDVKIWCKRLMRANELNPDPNTALVLTTSVMLGLVARQQTHRGQQIYMDMLGANAYANSDDFLNYPSKSPRRMPDESLHGLSPLYRLYACAQDQWVFLGLNSPRDYQKFASVLAAKDISRLPSDPEDTQIEPMLSQLFLTQTAVNWQALLGHVGCVQADRAPPNTFWTQDIQVESLNLLDDVFHSKWGHYRRHGPMVMFDGKRQPLGGPPLAGEHNEQVLRQIGYDAAEIDALYQTSALWHEA